MVKDILGRVHDDQDVIYDIYLGVFIMVTLG